MTEEPIHLSTRLALRPAEVAKALGVSERTVRQILPELPHLRIGTAVVVPVDSLRTWLQERARVEPQRVDSAVDEIMGSLESGESG